MSKRKILLIFFLIALFPIPRHTTTWPFNSIGSHFVSGYSSSDPKCEANEERWSGLLIGIQAQIILGMDDCAEWQKGWGTEIRCRFEERAETKQDLMDRPLPGVWSTPAGENSTHIFFGLNPLHIWHEDAGWYLFGVRIASSGVDFYTMNRYVYPNIVQFGECQHD